VFSAVTYMVIVLLLVLLWKIFLRVQ